MAREIQLCDVQNHEASNGVVLVDSYRESSNEYKTNDDRQGDQMSMRIP